MGFVPKGSCLSLLDSFLVYVMAHEWCLVCWDGRLRASASNCQPAFHFVASSMTSSLLGIVVFLYLIPTVVEIG